MEMVLLLSSLCYCPPSRTRICCELVVTLEQACGHGHRVCGALPGHGESLAVGYRRDGGCNSS